MPGCGIDERSAAFRAAVQPTPDLDAQVPTCELVRGPHSRIPFGSLRRSGDLGVLDRLRSWDI